MKQPKKQAGITVFYSYTSADSIWRDQLAAHLSQFKRNGFIEDWSDERILAGSDRAQAIEQAIRFADIILLLISADFLASDACQIEMQRALERQQQGKAHVIPILVRACDWQSSSCANLQCLPRNGQPVATWNDPDEAFVDIVAGLQAVLAKKLGVDEETVRRWEKGETRFPGLSAQNKLGKLGFAENPRLKRTRALSTNSPVSMGAEQSATSQQVSTPPRAEVHYGHDSHLSPQRRTPWVVLSTVGLVLLVCSFVLWRVGLFPGSPVTHPPVPTQAVSPFPTYYSFEDGTDNWTSQGYVLHLEKSDEYARQGRSSLKVTFQPANAQDYPFVRVDPHDTNPLHPLTAGQTVVLYVSVPTTPPVITVQAFIQGDSPWTSDPQVSTIPPHTWIKVSYTLPATVGAITWVGIQLSSTSSNVVSTLYLDAVGWS